MKLPEPLFKIINPVMGFLLRSPVHGLLSDSLMLITFTGRKSGRQFTTPVRYLRIGDTVRCFTAKENQWWRNLREPSEVGLRVAGKDGKYTAQATVDDPDKIREWLKLYLTQFPQDAAYHNVRFNKDKSLVETDLEHAVHDSVVVECRPN